MKRISISVRCTVLMLVFSLLFSLSASAQQGKVNVDVKNVSLKEFFNVIEQQTDYRFSYRDSELEGKPSVTVKVTNADLASLLVSELSKADLRYTLVNDKIVVTPQPKESPEVTVSGKIVDRTGEPVIGASALVKGTSRGVIADADGKFTMTVRKDDVVVFSCLGYSDQELRIGGSNRNIEIVLEDDFEMLNEAVAVGYGTTLRKNLTTSVATIKAESVSKAANSNMSQLLMGKAAGLRANISSTQPGGNVSISIRGGGTPIYIVDGVMMPSGSLEVGNGTIETPNSINRAGLAGLNPGDIESIEVLKDASAAIYGINAANGVILITTKKGTEGAPRVTLESSYSFVRNYKYLEPLTSKEYMNFANIFSKTRT